MYFRCSISKQTKHGFFYLWVYSHVPCVTFRPSFAAPAGSDGGRHPREEEEVEALKKKQLQEEKLSKVGETFPVFMSQYMSADWCEYMVMNMFLMHIDPIWSGEAHSEGREGERADQGATCSQPLCSSLRHQTKKLRYRSELVCVLHTLHLIYWNVEKF